jgi:RND family efflux transporter MFP subunit
MAAFLAACGESHSPEATTTSAVDYGPGIVVEVEPVRVGVPVEGTVVARNRTEITTRMMARVLELPVDIGSHVRAGQVLVRLGTEDIASNRAKAEAAVGAARAALDEAVRHVARMDALLAQDVVPQVQRDQAALQRVQAESQMAMANAALRDVETAASYATILAPFEGEVVERLIDHGDVAAPGMPMMVVEQSGPRDGRLSVPSTAAEHLAIGSVIRVTAVGGRAVDAPVRVVSAGADPRSRTVDVRVVLPADWPTGVSLSALVPVETVQALTIPVDAVVYRGQLTGVRILTADGPSLRWIRLGRRTDGGDRVEVLTGLSAGERIMPAAGGGA